MLGEYTILPGVILTNPEKHGTTILANGTIDPLDFKAAPVSRRPHVEIGNRPVVWLSTSTCSSPPRLMKNTYLYSIVVSSESRSAEYSTNVSSVSAS